MKESGKKQKLIRSIMFRNMKKGKAYKMNKCKGLEEAKKYASSIFLTQAERGL